MKEYIERRELIAMLKADMAFCVGDSSYSKGAKTGFNAGINYATVLPAADVVERKRGEWVEVEFGWGDVYYDCSVCGESFCIIDGTPTDNLYNFCPNCGADMREVDHETD